MAVSGCEPAPDAVRTQLRRVLESDEFDASERNRHFLTYVVEEALAGRAERIKAYSIATSIFGREASFDPQTDPIVRIEARRLRRSLERYYLTAGKNDPIHIKIPKGSYAPAFEVGEVQASDIRAADSEKGAVRSLARARHGPVIFVSPFEEEGDQSAYPNITRGFTRQVIVGLTRFTDLFVLGPETTFLHGLDADTEKLRVDLGMEFKLIGGTTLSADRFGVEALLIDVRTGQYLWADSFERELRPTEIVKVRDEVANCVARTLAQPYGVIFGNKARETDGEPPDALSSYECVVRFYQYWRSYDRELHEQARACLEQTIINDPGYAEAFACLSQIYADAYRFGFDVSDITADPRKRAVALAVRAIELAPNSSRGYHALSQAYWFTRDVRGSLDALETARVLNPNDTMIMADLGLRYSLLAEWEKAVPLVESSFARNPAQPSTYRIGLSLNHYFHGQYDKALIEAEKIEAPDIVYGFLVVAVAAAQLGRQGKAKAAVEAILAVDPTYGDHVVADLEKRNLHRDLIAALVGGLRKAGLQGSETTSAHIVRPASPAA